MKSINERIVDKFDAVGHWGTSRPQDYYKFVAECMMERMCGLRCSHTVSVICQEVGYLTVNGNTTKLGRMFAHSYYVLGWRGEAMKNAISTAKKKNRFEEVFSGK